MSGGTTRRGFVVGCSAAIASLAGSRLSGVVLSPGPEGHEGEIIVVLSLRGGMDALSLVMPIDGEDRTHYEIARPQLEIPISGTGAALPLDGFFGLHPSAAPLLELFDSGKVAIVNAAGAIDLTRSHFQAMENIDHGQPQSPDGSGWLTRHLDTANLPPDVLLPSLSIGSIQHAALDGDLRGVNMRDVNSFSLETGAPAWRSAQRSALRNIYSGNFTDLHTSGIQALDALDLVELYVTEDYVPANGAAYPESGFGANLQAIAQMIKLDLGVQVATVTIGGWDTHESQAEGATGYFADMIDNMTRGLLAFYTDLDGVGANNYTSRLTVVVQSEFGRKLRENADFGTDHGHGGTILVISGNAIGGVHGVWPGLANEQLFDGTDLEVTTDYRQILSEILIRRAGNPNLSVIFPGYEGYEPLGIVQGVDLPPV